MSTYQENHIWSQEIEDQWVSEESPNCSLSSNDNIRENRMDHSTFRVDYKLQRGDISSSSENIFFACVNVNSEPGKNVVLKRRRTREETVEMFANEAAISLEISSARHPNILLFYKQFTCADELYLVMDQCLQGACLKLKEKPIKPSSGRIMKLTNMVRALTLSSTSLRRDKMKMTDYITYDGQIYFTKAAANELMRQVIDALVTMHTEFQYAHLDLKPENILIELDPVGKPIPKLMDFGLTTKCEGDKPIFLGDKRTAAFCSPERESGADFNGFKDDVWCIAAVYFALRTGKFLFNISGVTGMSRLEVEKRVREMVEFVREPAFLADALLYDSDARPSMTELREALG